MKGFSLYADLLSIFILIGIIMLASLLLWTLIIIYNVEINLGTARPRTIELTFFFNPVKYDTTLMSFLETQHNGIPMKKILNAVAIQENSIVWLEGKEINDLSTFCDNFLSPKIGSNPYILKVVLPSKEIILVEKPMPSFPDTPLHLQETTSKLFLLDGSTADMKLLVFIK